MIESKKGKVEVELPFDSKRKRQTTVIKMNDGTIRVFVKGATEKVAEICSKVHHSNG